MNNKQKELKRKKQIKYRIGRLQQLDEARHRINNESEKSTKILAKLIAFIGV